MEHADASTRSAEADRAGSRGEAAKITFSSLLSDVTTQTFCREYWGRKPLHVARGDAGYYRGLIDLAEIEHCLSTDEFFDRHAVATPFRSDGVPDTPPRCASEVFERLADGKPLRLRRLETLLRPDSPVMALLRDMQGVLHHPTASLSCYVAPADGRGLGPHHDETEIFTLQIAGAKTWQLFHKVVADEPFIYEAEMLGEPEQEIRLAAGDLLYLPSGCVHNVVADAEPSFALTIVFEPFRWRAVLDLLAARLGGVEAFADVVPAVPRHGSEADAAFEQAFADRIALIRDALGQLTAADLGDDLRVRHLRRIPYPPGRQIDSVFRSREIESDTRLVVAPDLPWHLARTGETVTLTLPGGYTLQARAQLEPALRQVLDNRAPFRVGDMQGGLGAGARIALAKRLVGCGLLRLAESRSHSR